MADGNGGNLAQLIRKRSQEAHDSLVGAETRRQWDEAMALVEAAADGGRSTVTWHESGGYLESWQDEVRYDACEAVIDRLVAEGFDVLTDRRGHKDKGVVIYW